VNRSPYDLGKVTLLFQLKDATGKVVAVSSRDEFTLLKGERRAYVQPWPGLQSSLISQVIVRATTDVFDPKNLSTSTDSTGSSLDHKSFR
jgi:hypothetical protein